MDHYFSTGGGGGGGSNFGKINCLHTKNHRKKLSAEKILQKNLFAQHW